MTGKEAEGAITMRHLIISALFILVGVGGIIYAVVRECVAELSRRR